MREVVLDTETTGLSPLAGDRLVEIGCVELMNRFPTGRTWQAYVDPERDMPEAAFAVHGISGDFLRGKPKFAEIADAFLAFVEDANLVIHNADFDMGFINMELGRIGRPALTMERVVNTLTLARRRHPGVSNRLDDLCARYGIDSTARTKHGALLDAQLLAEVYAELAGGRQAAMSLDHGAAGGSASRRPARKRPAPLGPRLTEAEAAAHAAFVASLSGEVIWKDYPPEG